MRDIIEVASLGLLSINTLLFLRGLKLYKFNSYKWFCAFLVFTLIISSIVSYTAYKVINNLAFSHYYFTFQFLLFSFFFKELFRSKKQKNFVNITIILTLLILIYLFSSGKIQYYTTEPFNPIQVFICSFPIIVFSIMHLYNSLDTDFRFLWITAGILIYLSVSTFVFILGGIINDLKNPKYWGLGNILWGSHEYFVLLFYVLIFIEWYKSFRLKKIKF